MALHAERAAAFAPILAALREHERTEAWLARQLGVSKEMVRNYKLGAVRPPLAQVVAACTKLGIPVPPFFLTPAAVPKPRRRPKPSPDEEAARPPRRRGRPPKPKTLTSVRGPPAHAPPLPL